MALPDYAAAPAMPADALRRLARLALAEGGLHIGEDKSDFLNARLQHQLIRLNIDDYSAYAAHLEAPGRQADLRFFIEALTTHTTSFFRENAQYEWLRETGLPERVAAGVGVRRPLEIWSAACSSGQELYSALMCVAAARPPGEPPLLVRGLGTDLSTTILRRAELAIYSREEIAGIPEELRRRFLLSAKDDANRFRICAELRDRSRWEQINLTRPHGSAAPPVDVVLLRNVLIYFDPQTRDRVLRHVIGRIAPGGVLMTGHSETIEAKSYALRTLRPSIYLKEA